LLSFSAKWLGEEKVEYADQSSAGNLEKDAVTLRKVWKLLDQADIVVAHNGRGFDIPVLNARFLHAGIPPPSPYRVFDTLVTAKKVFGFTSNKLEYLANFLGCKVRKRVQREFSGFELWKACLARNRRAWKEMRLYNIDDILTLEEVYLKLRPWDKQHPNVGMFDDSATPVCPKCGGRVQKRGLRTSNFGMYQNFQCTECKGWSRGRQLLGERSIRKLQLSQ